MPQVPRPPATFKVNIIESERGWGSKIDETIYFDNEAEARQYADDYNAKYNTATEVPDWYMRADYVGSVS
jgi:hypothetical protein